MTEAGLPAKSRPSSRARFMTRFAAILWKLALVAVVAPAQAQPGKVLRYVSQRADKAYLREGPSFAHRVLWVYRHKGYPFAVLAEFDVWRRVRAADGAIVRWYSVLADIDDRRRAEDARGLDLMHARPQ